MTDKLSQIRFLIVLVSGSPGIGKTSFSDELDKQINQSNEQKIASYKLSYDRLMDKTIESALILNDNWKRCRSLIVSLVKLLIEYISSSCDTEFADFINSSSSLETIDAAYSIRLNFIKSISEQLTPNRQKSKPFDNRIHLIIIDDIFYYESMRYVFYKLCFQLSEQKILCSYFNVCFKCTNLQLLRTRNETRHVDHRLPDSIVENVFNKFEYSKDWEVQYSQLIEINNNADFSLTTFDFGLFVQNLVEKHHHQFVQFMLERIRLLKEQESRQQEHNLNLIHQCDLILRKLVKQILTDLNDKHEIQSTSKRLQTKKQNLLTQLKSADSELLKKFSLFHTDLEKIENELKLLLIEN